MNFIVQNIRFGQKYIFQNQAQFKNLEKPQILNMWSRVGYYGKSLFTDFLTFKSILLVLLSLDYDKA
jgi:hypothetical protein